MKKALLPTPRPLPTKIFYNRHCSNHIVNLVVKNNYKSHINHLLGYFFLKMVIRGNKMGNKAIIFKCVLVFLFIITHHL